MADLKPIDVFLDIENFGMRSNYKEQRNKLLRFMQRMTAALKRLGYQPREMWSASAARRNQRYEEMVTAIMRTYGMTMQWSEGRPTADAMLIREMRRQLQEGTLPATVLLVTGDADFKNIAHDVVHSGRRLIVAAEPCTLSGVLKRTATEAIDINNLCKLGAQHEG